ncbi:hypothetical protein ACQPVP_09210 [Clostridium nigeriense]|uniref:hypothetical protein n=1 Tax=Clostridium nigeriense TaxID=1805470 RepID=UPI003D329C33
MLNKEVNEILMKFAEKCTSINSNVGYNDCLKIGRDIVWNIATEDIRLLIRTLNYEIVKLKRIYHKPTDYKGNIEPKSIEEFIKKIDSKVLNEIKEYRNVA